MRRRNIAVFFDGTGQNRSLLMEREWGNVTLLHDAVRMMDNKDIVQRRTYVDGVGTRSGEELSGGGFGIGLDECIEESYNSLYQEVNFAKEDGEEPHLYLFGFSRGAYSARWLASLIQFSGIPKVGVSPRTLFTNHRNGDVKAADKIRKQGRVWDDVTTDFMGVWDTVEASVNPSFDIENVPERVLRVYHALALDEWRYTFNPTRFNPSDKVQEVWFPGCHSDVGGGYGRRALANASLWWMISGARAAGLVVDEELVESFLATRSSEVYYHDELSEGKDRRRWKALNAAAGYAGRFYRTVGDYDTMHPAKDWYASAAPTKRTRIPNTCIVLNAEPHRNVARAIV